MEEKKNESKKPEKIEKQVEEMEEKPVELTAIETLDKFTDAIKQGKYEKAFELTQKTWQESSINPKSAFEVLANYMTGKIHIREKRKISEMCYMFEVKTSHGTFSAKVIKESAPYKPDIDGVWGVNPHSIRKL